LPFTSQAKTHASGDDFRLFSSLEIPVGQGLSGWVFQNEKHMLNGNPSVEASYLKNADTVTTMRSALAVPLQAPEGVIGTLTLYRREPDAFTPDDLRIVLAVSTKVALAIDNALKYQRAESSATTDYLTGLPNARSLFIQLDHELSRAKRGHSGLGLMVCDLDNFKQINDCYGHLTGNKVLQLFAQSLRGVFREYDYAARMGGDEFVVVVPGLVEEAAAAKVLALRRVISEISSQLTGEASLGVSVGVAFFPEDGTDAEQLLAEADRKMYNVKKASHGERRSSSPARAHVMAAEEAVLMVSNN
jgi:diguanylate cyclase (GGDEF)-like protein